MWPVLTIFLQTSTLASHASPDADYHYLDMPNEMQHVFYSKGLPRGRVVEGKEKIKLRVISTKFRRSLPTKKKNAKGKVSDSCKDPPPS